MNYLLGSKFIDINIDNLDMNEFEESNRCISEVPEDNVHKIV